MSLGKWKEHHSIHNSSTLIIMASTIFFVLALTASAAASSYNLSLAPISLGNLDQYGPYYQGDMRFGEGQLDQVKSGINRDYYRWRNAQVPVYFDPSFTDDEKNTIIYGLQDIMYDTCIRFYYYRPGTDEDYINIIKGKSGSGCWSYVGRQGGKQDLNLQADGCIHKRIPAHEMMHALGFFHEQSRPDRDDYVSIQLQNVQSGTEHNFEKYTTDQVTTYGVLYDCGSVMHYDQYAFSKNQQQTIVPKNCFGRRMGQRDALSDRDSEKLNRMYCGA